MIAREPRGGAGEPLVFARDQPEFEPLPARRTADGLVTTEWELTPEERWRIANGARIRLELLTFNRRLQPIRLSVAEEA